MRAALTETVAEGVQMVCDIRRVAYRQVNRPVRYARVVAEEHKPLTLEEVDAMSPSERAAVLDAHYARPGVIITDLDELPPKIRARAVATAERIAHDRARTE